MPDQVLDLLDGDVLVEQGGDDHDAKRVRRQVGGESGCGEGVFCGPWPPEPIAKEKAEFDRRMKENIDALRKRTAPKNPGQVPPDSIPGDDK